MDVYCGRPGPWGNPYRIGPDGDRAAVIAKHKAHIRRRLRSGQLTLEQLAALSGKKLGCHCKPQPSPADYLAQLADAARSVMDTIKLFQKRGATPPAVTRARRAAQRIMAAGKGNINLTPDNRLEIREKRTRRTPDDTPGPPPRPPPGYNPQTPPTGAPAETSRGTKEPP